MSNLQNTIDKAHSPEQLKAYDEALTIIETLTADFPVLSATEKARRVKAPEGSVEWRNNMLVRAEQNLDKMPRSFDAEKVKRDLKLEADLEPRKLRLERLVDRLESAILMAASDSFSSGLFVRRQLRSLGVAGVDDGLDDGLRTFFKRSGDDEEPTTTVKP